MNAVRGTASATLAPAKSAFERNLLPGFAEWLVEQIEHRQPDYLIPAETKGARLLDAALAFARQELGAQVSTPIIYGSALAYLSPEELRTARVVVVDDAVRSGSNLRRHSSQIAGHGVAEIEAIVCVGCGTHSERRPNVSCYVEVDSALYERYAWQLTELVVGRGLPPEVDHFLLELRLNERLTRGWAELTELLHSYGTLTIDGPERRRDEMQPMTLHFPRLPGAEALQSETADGAYKLRFFPDPEHERVRVVPISFSTLTLPGVEQGEHLSPSRVRETIATELGGELPPIGELLAGGARAADPRALFRAISVCREVEMACGLARLLGGKRAATLRVQPDVFERLYGAGVGSAVGARVAEEIELALGQRDEAPEIADPAPVEPVLFLDGDVATATHGIARDLKRLYDEAAATPGHDPANLIGLSMGEVAAELDGEDPLLASRCVDFGLALTTLVPYVAEIPDTDGSALSVERRYRVSENNRGRQHPYVSLDTIRQQKSEETLALICKRLRERCEAYRGKPVPVSVLAPLVGILQPLVLAPNQITLKSSSLAADGSDLVLLDTVNPISFDEITSAHFSIEHGALTPTEGFESSYRRKGLWLDLDDCTEGIENSVDDVVELLAATGETNLRELLEGWELCTDRRLGLSHVRVSLDGALQILRRPLNLIRAGQDHERSSGLAELVRPAVERAERRLELLAADWSEPAREAIPQPSGRREERLMSSLAAPSEGDELYGLARALVGLTTSLAGLVEGLDAASFDAWRREAGEEQHAVAQEACTWSARARQALCSLGEEEPRVAELAADPQEAIGAAAAELLDLIELIGAFGAALAGSYCGQKGQRTAPPNAQDARHATILSLDLAGSTSNAESARNAKANRLWVGEGLNIAAQWTRALGGYEFSDRKGDELTAEFEDGDAAALAGAAVLCHTAALRSSGVVGLSWEFHTGVECGEIDDGDGSNLIGSPINRAAKLAKEADAQAQGRYVPIADEGARHCSAQVGGEPLSVAGDEVAIGDVRLRPRLLDATAAMRAMASRVQAIAERIAAELPDLKELEPSLRTEPETVRQSDDETGEAVSG